MRSMSASPIDFTWLPPLLWRTGKLWRGVRPDTAPVLAAQRATKILGIFTRLWRRDGKERYPSLCPRVWAYLERGLSQPVLRPVAEWFDANIPPEKRGDPLVLSR